MLELEKGSAFVATLILEFYRKRNKPREPKWRAKWNNHYVVEVDVKLMSPTAPPIALLTSPWHGQAIIRVQNLQKASLFLLWIQEPHLI